MPNSAANRTNSDQTNVMRSARRGRRRRRSGMPRRRWCGAGVAAALVRRPRGSRLRRPCRAPCCPTRSGIRKSHVRARCTLSGRNTVHPQRSLLSLRVVYVVLFQLARRGIWAYCVMMVPCVVNCMLWRVLCACSTCFDFYCLAI